VSLTDLQEKIEAVQKMQDHIESNLRQPISMAALARAAGYSPWHSARLFREVTGRAPFDYIRAYRLSMAALQLVDRRERVLDVALDFVFASHEGFTRAFSRQFGVPPREYARRAPPGRMFLPVRVRAGLLALRKGEKTMSDEEKEKSSMNTVFVQVIERPARGFILKRGIAATDYFEYCEEVGCDVWDTLTGIRDALYEPIGAWMPPSMVPDGTSEYVQGVEVPLDYAGPVPDGFERTDLPACKMMVFQGPPFKDEDFGDAIGDLWEIMKTYDPTRYGFQWADEDGPRFQMEPQGYRGYIEARPVRPA
jgi:AraC family transcriptional regulator